MKTRPLIGLLIILLALSACDSSAPSQDIHIGQLYLRSEISVLGFEEQLFRTVDWSEGDAIIGELHNDRIPEWAEGFAITCVQWEEDFTRSFLQNSESEESQQIIQHGHAQGWILVGDRPGEFHILELTVEFEGITYDWIDAWDAPE
jgi:hypothetical protein